MKKSAIRHYTLIEILAVIAIIGILAGITLGVTGAVSARRSAARTEALLKQIEVALESARNKYGYYPQQPGGGYFLIPEKSDSTPSAKVEEFYLIKNAASPTYLDHFIGKAEFEKLRRNAAEIDGEFVVLDGWNRPIYYRCPGARNPDSYDLFSAGADNKIGDSDTLLCNPATRKMDIPADALAKKFDPTLGDDLGNF